MKYKRLHCIDGDVVSRHDFSCVPPFYVIVYSLYRKLNNSRKTHHDVLYNFRVPAFVIDIIFECTCNRIIISAWMLLLYVIFYMAKWKIVIDCCYCIVDEQFCFVPLLWVNVFLKKINERLFIIVHLPIKYNIDQFCYTFSIYPVILILVDLKGYHFNLDYVLSQTIAILLKNWLFALHQFILLVLVWFCTFALATCMMRLFKIEGCWLKKKSSTSWHAIFETMRIAWRKIFLTKRFNLFQTIYNKHMTDYLHV